MKLNVLVAGDCQLFVTPPATLLRKLLGSRYDCILPPCSYLADPRQVWEPSTALVVYYNDSPGKGDGRVWERLMEFVRSGGRLLTIGSDIPSPVAGNSMITSRPAVEEIVETADGAIRWKSLCHQTPITAGNNLRQLYYPSNSLQQFGNISNTFNRQQQHTVLAKSVFSGRPLVWRQSENWIHSCAHFDVDDSIACCLSGSVSDDSNIDQYSQHRLAFLYRLLSEELGLLPIRDDSSIDSSQPNDNRYWLAFESDQEAEAFKQMPGRITLDMPADNSQQQQHPVRIVSNQECLLSDAGKLFDFEAYFARISQCGNNTIGRQILFADTVYSTQTLLENFENASKLPPSVVHLANLQLAGRGRGVNSWISHRGCLQFSFRINYGPVDRNMVFVQYLMALSVVKAVHELSLLDCVRIKWPNDIYCKHSSGELVKIGGILVNSSSINPRNYNLIVGCGLNVDNQQPTVAINSLLPTGHTKLSRGTLLAEIMIQFSGLFERFIRCKSFQPFLPEYYKFWLHGNQRILISQDASISLNSPSVSDRQGVYANIVGLTDDGYLLARSDSGESFELLPGTNSFNLTDGMICRKRQ